MLFVLGVELPGRRLVDFAVRVRGPSRLDPDTRVRQAMAGIEDGPLALVAENPELGDERVPDSARTFAEAADAAVYALGLRLLEAPEPSPLRQDGPGATSRRDRPRSV